MKGKVQHIEKLFVSFLLMPWKNLLFESSPVVCDCDLGVHRCPLPGGVGEEEQQPVDGALHQGPAVERVEMSANSQSSTCLG